MKPEISPKKTPKITPILSERDALNRAEFYKDLFTHDINNILQNILSGIELLEIGLAPLEIPEEIQETYYIIRDQVLKGVHLVSNVRKLSKLDKISTSMEKSEIFSILDKSIHYIEGSFKNRALQISVNSAINSFYITCNELMEDVFENILTNSIRHNENKPINIEIHISELKEKEVNYVRIEFRDNSIGIEDRRKEMVFLRGKNNAENIHGMGIGLSLVQKIIESYNGRIWVEDRIQNDYTKGCNFVLMLPENL